MPTMFPKMSLCLLLTFGAMIGVRGEEHVAPRQVFVPLSPTSGSTPTEAPQLAQLGVQIPVDLLHHSTNSKAVDELEYRTEQMQIELASLSSRFQDADSPIVFSNVNDDIVSGYGDTVHPGWHFDLDVLTWKLETRNSVFAITTDDSSLSVGSGNVQSLDPGWETGVRTRLARRTESGWLLGAAYTTFQSQDSAVATAAPGGNLWATRSHPDSFEEAATANASTDFNLNLFDLEMLYPKELTDSVAMELFGGLRWAHINQDFNTRYDGIDFTNGDVTKQSDMTGFGARFGAAFHWLLRDTVSVYGRGSGSVLYGRFDQQLRETNVNGADTLVDVAEEFGRPVTAIETAVGVAWQYREWLQIRGGYELTNWMGIQDGAYFPDDSHEGLYSTPADDTLLHGGFLRIAVSR